MNFFRNKAAKAALAIFTAFFLGIFGFGAFSIFTDDQTTIASVEGKKIKITDYLKLYELLSENARQSSQEITKDLDNYIKRQSLRQLVTQKVISIDFEDIGLSISDTEIINYIKNIPAFSDENGKFDLKIYNKYLANINSTTGEFEGNIRNDLQRRKYINIFSAAARVPEILEDYYTTRFNRTALVDYFKMPSVIFEEEVVEASDDLLQTIYKQNKGRFREKIKIVSLLEINKDATITQISDQDVIDYYEQNKEGFINKASFKSSHILFSLESNNSQREIKKEADLVYQQLVKDKTKFAEFAKKYSDDPGSKEKGGALGWTSYGEFVEDFENVVKELEIGELSKPFISEFGYHIVILEDKKAAVFQKFEDVKIGIKENLNEEKFSIFFKKVARSVNRRKERSFSLIANDFQVVKFVEEFELTKSTKFEGIELEKVFFDLEGKETNYSNYYTKDGEKFIFYRLKDIDEGSIKEYKDVKNKVAEIFRLNQIRQSQNNKIIDYRKKYKLKEDFNKLAKELKVKVTESEEVYYNRQDQSGSFTNILKNNIFKVNASEVLFIGYRNDVYVVVINELKEDLGTNSSDALFTKDYLEELKFSTLVNRIVSNRAKELDISYNNTLIKRYNIPTI